MIRLFVSSESDEFLVIHKDTFLFVPDIRYLKRYIEIGAGIKFNRDIDNIALFHLGGVTWHFILETTIDDAINDLKKFKPEYLL